MTQSQIVVRDNLYDMLKDTLANEHWAREQAERRLCNAFGGEAQTPPWFRPGHEMIQVDGDGTNRTPIGLLALNVAPNSVDVLASTSSATNNECFSSESRQNHKTSGRVLQFDSMWEEDDVL